MLDPDQADAARDALVEVLDSIDIGDLDATKAQRAHIAGAVAGLDLLARDS